MWRNVNIVNPTMSRNAETLSVVRHYVATLDDEARLQHLNTTVDQVLLVSQSLLADRSKCKRTVHFCTHIEPIIRFIQRYSKAVDVMVQQTTPVALAWGCLRFLLEVSCLHPSQAHRLTHKAVGSFTSYFNCLSSTIQQIGDQVSTCKRFKEIHSDWDPFRKCLTAVYYDVLAFLFKVNQLFHTNRESIAFLFCCMNLADSLVSGLRLFGKAIFNTFDQEFQGCISSVSRHMALLEEQATFIHHRTTHLERRRQVMAWLAPVSFDNNLVGWWSRTTQGTNQWFLNSHQYTSWRDEQSHDSVMWLKGNAGVGKTFLSSSIVQDLRHVISQTSGVGLGYFFFDATECGRSSLLEASASIIAQISANCERIPAELLRRYESASRCGRSTISSLDNPMDILADALTGFRKAYLILDGIDESQEIAVMIREILTLKDISNVRILFVGRETNDTRTALSTYTTLKLEPALVQDDIDLFLRQELSRLAEQFEQFDLEYLTFDRLSATAKGSFLWAHLMIQNLRRAPNISTYLSMTTQLPVDLQSFYRSTLKSLSLHPVSTRTLGKDLLYWVCFAKRPLQWKELQHALSFDHETGAFRHDCLPFKSSVLELCNPLIDYDSNSDEFRPVHWSVCEFLARESNAQRQFGNIHTYPDPHFHLLQVCLSTLVDPAVIDAVHIQHNMSSLARYATLNWCDHLFQAQPSMPICETLNRFIVEKDQRRTWIARYMVLQVGRFPLQAMLQQLRRVQSRLPVSADQPSPPGSVFDILEDMFETMLVLATHCAQDQSCAIFGPDLGLAHFEIMMIVRDLARSYTLAERIPDALGWLDAALKRVQEAYGNLNTRHVWLLNSLGIMYDQQKEFGLAVDVQLEALAIQQREHPPEHLDIVGTMNELGRVYRHLGRLTDAEEMHRQALRILHIQFSEDDPQIVWTKGTLGRTLRFQGRIAEALALHEEVLAAQTKSVGSDHCHTLWTKSDIARCLRDQGKLLEALLLFQEVVEGRTKTLGELHADTLWSLNDLGLALSQCGRHTEAKVHHEKALRGQVSSLGDGHEQTVWTRKVLAEWTGRCN